MLQLEERFYTLDEIAELTQTNRHCKLKRDACRKLKAWGYEYEWLDRRGVTITAYHPTPEMKLRELLVEYLRLDSQVDIIGFADFIIALSRIPGFDTMPWTTRTEVLYEHTGKYIADSTLRGWASKLIATDNAMKGGKDALWHTYTENGIKRREWLPMDDARYKEYCARRVEILEALKDSDLPQKQHWNTMEKMLYGEYGKYYYCSRLMLNALGKNIDELCDLVEQITEQQNE
ncbi:MAG: hypothetical protein J6M20_08985 [Clostridia bacterium]|nr:hypothetical protein [Clostridia bacterium]